ncbi:MAG: hypothetical protein L6265_06385 [Thermoplasmatales archaeon]|nr:hypothetical protein [Thermoplasmatales archaeon]
MKATERIRYLAWKSMQKNLVSDLRNQRREKAVRVKWKKESMAWGHEHPKR